MDCFVASLLAMTENPESISDHFALKRPRKRAAVDQDVLAGDVARLSAGEEGAEFAELFRSPEALGRDRRLALAPRRRFGNSARLGLLLKAAPQAVGVEGAGLDRIDGHIVLGDLPGGRGEEGRQSRPRPGGNVKPGDWRAHRRRRDVEDAAEAPLDHAVDDA